MVIDPPKRPTYHPDRHLDCQMAMEDALRDLADAAVEAGWEPDEVRAALLELADNWRLGHAANEETARQIATARREG